MTTSNIPAPPPDPEEVAAKVHASRLRFRQSIFQTAGGAMLFALFGVITSKLLTLGSGTAAATAGAATATHTAAAAAATAGASLFSAGTILPILGIAAVALIGLGCVYVAANYLSDIIEVEQDSQAKKIQKAGKEKGLETPSPESEIGRKSTLSPILTAQSSMDADEANATPAVTASPALTIQGAGAQWMDRVQPDRDRAQAATANRKATADSSWAAQVEATAGAQTLARA